MKNILVTGSEGFVGSSLRLHLEKLKYNIYTLDRLDISRENYLCYDLKDEFNEIFESKIRSFNIDVVIHLAAAKGDFRLSDKDFHDDNVIATNGLRNIIEKCEIHNVIHYSTVSVYGHNNLLKDESAELKPNNPYGVTKLESEKIFFF